MLKMKLHRHSSFKERFWDRIDKTETCWLWKGHGDGRYGFVSYNKRQERAHRVSWMLQFGSVPKGLYVLHMCDVTNCVNPDHLFLGTHNDNMKDKAKKGRASRKLTLQTAKEIIRRSKTESQYSLAKEFGVDQSLVSRIKNGELWQHAIKEELCV